MAKLIIRGCSMVTMNAARDEIENGDIHIKDGRFTHVGSPLSSVPTGTEVIDGRGKVAIPGLVNTHHHLFQSMLRGLSYNQNVIEWVQSCIFPASPHARPQDLYNAVRLSLAECLESGVTTTIDWAYYLHSLEHGLATFEAMRESGVRVHFGYGPSAAKGWGDFDIRLKDFEEIRHRFFATGEHAGRMRLWMALGGPELSQEEGRIREEVQVAKQHGCSLHIHVRENEAGEPKNCVEVLERCGALGPQLVMAHAVHLSDSDLDRVQRSGAKVSYNALSNMRLASGICRVVEMRQRGIDVSLGVDGSASNDNADYFALMRAALGLQRVRWQRGDSVTVHDIVEMATLGGAQCLGQEAEIGSLEKGKRADVVLIDPQTLNFMPLNNFVPQLVLCAQPRNVDTVIVEGQVLKRKGKLVGVDVGELMAKCQESARYITRKAGFTLENISFSRRSN